MSDTDMIEVRRDQIRLNDPYIGKDEAAEVFEDMMINNVLSKSEPIERTSLLSRLENLFILTFITMLLYVWLSWEEISQWVEDYGEDYRNITIKITIIILVLYLVIFFVQYSYVKRWMKVYQRWRPDEVNVGISLLPLPKLRMRIRLHVISGNLEKTALLNYLQTSDRPPVTFTLFNHPEVTIPLLLVETTMSQRFRLSSLREDVENWERLLRSMRFEIVDSVDIPPLRKTRYIHSFKGLASIYQISERIARAGFSDPMLFQISFKTPNTYEKLHSRVQSMETRVEISYSVEDRRQLKMMKSFIQSICISPKISKSPIESLLDSEQTEILAVFPFTSVEEIMAIKDSFKVERSGSSQLNQVHIDRKMENLIVTKSFEYNPIDYTQGGLITGGIGTGKTTMRLHIMKALITSGTRIIDIDFKGDAARYKFFRKWGKVYIPKVNLRINPFSVPDGKDTKEYTNQLTRALIETLGENEELSPPQRNLLYEAVKRTVRLKGNAKDFFENISRLSYRDSMIIDNRQDHTAVALLNKFQWFESTMREIFWVPESNLDAKIIIEDNSYIDLSKINDTVPVEQMRFLIDLILMNFTIALKDKGEQYKYNRSGKRIPKYAIFLDEGQYLVPRKSIGRSELSRLEEIISTFRYKGVAVIASGVSAEFMSSMLTDSGFIAQFRTDSTVLIRALGLSEEISETIPRLLNFQAFVKAESTNHEPVLIQTKPFPFEKMSEDDYRISIPVTRQDTLEEFNRGIVSHIYRELLESVSYDVPRPLRTILEEEGRAFLRTLKPMETDVLLNIEKHIEHIGTGLGNTILNNFKTMSSTSRANVQDFASTLFLQYTLISLTRSKSDISRIASTRRIILQGLSKVHNEIVGYLLAIFDTLDH